MIVVDTNILIYLSCPQEDQRLAADAGRVIAKAGNLLLPSLWRQEYLSVLSKFLGRKQISLEDAAKLWSQALALYEMSEAKVEMLRALELSQSLSLTTYDAQFVALAEHASTVLVTEDRRLRASVGKRALSMEEYLAA
jgi:predicted nucleic acid-binding protein